MLCNVCTCCAFIFTRSTVPTKLTSPRKLPPNSARTRGHCRCTRNRSKRPHLSALPFGTRPSECSEWPSTELDLDCVYCVTWQKKTPEAFFFFVTYIYLLYAMVPRWSSSYNVSVLHINWKQKTVKLSDCRRMKRKTTRSKPLDVKSAGPLEVCPGMVYVYSNRFTNYVLMCDKMKDKRKSTTTMVLRVWAQLCRY